MDPDHSLLLPYQISDVEVFDYQLAGLKTEIIRPSLISMGLIHCLRICLGTDFWSNVCIYLWMTILHIFPME